MITAEEVYQSWKKECNAARGIHVSKTKNLEKVKAKETWVVFEEAAYMFNRNAGHVNVEEYIRLLAKEAKGWFHPSDMLSQRSIRLYREFVKKERASSSPEDIRRLITSSAKFVIEFCQALDIRTIDEYFFHDANLIPSCAKHLYAGSISPYFLCSFSTFSLALQAYPPDVLEEYFREYVDDANKYRSRCVFDPSLRKVVELLPDTIDRMLSVR